MNIVIPPVIFYVIGAALVVGGTVRALTLGRRNPEREISDDDPARARARKRHFTFGLIWVAMGLFLILSTVGVLRSKWGSGSPSGDGAATSLRPVPRPTPTPTRAPTPGIDADRTAPEPSRLLPGTAPTIRLEPVPPTTGAPPAKP